MRAILGGDHDGNGKFSTERLVARPWQIEDLPQKWPLSRKY
jgi:hypothetical protein